MNIGEQIRKREVIVPQPMKEPEPVAEPPQAVPEKVPEKVK